MLQAFLISFGVIFVAELGDKSQLMALAFATRYKPAPILIARHSSRQWGVSGTARISPSRTCVARSYSEVPRGISTYES